VDTKPGQLSAVIDLNVAIRISPVESHLHAFDVFDVTGLAWRFWPEGLDEDDCRTVCSRWLDIFSVYCLPSTDVVNILKSGPLLKRGGFNTAFRSRWFVLSSDYKLRYYTDDLSGVFKGEIDLRMVDRTSHTADAGRSVSCFGREIVITQKSRVWRLQAVDAADAQRWTILLNQVISAIFGRSVLDRLEQGEGGDKVDSAEGATVDDEGDLESDLFSTDELERRGAIGGYEMMMMLEEDDHDISDFIIGNGDERYSVF
jgi:hypothetical protein